jgi:CRP-like cAMP-binding protein
MPDDLNGVYMKKIFLKELIEKNRELMDLFKLIDFKENEIIFDEGDKGEEFYIIESGTVIIEKSLNKEQSEFKELAKILEGDFFGEAAVIDDKPRSARARTASKCKIYKIEKKDFFDIIYKKPKEAIEIFSQITLSALDRLRNTSRELALLFDISKLLSKQYKEEKEFLKEMVKEVALFFEGDWNIYSYCYNYFNDEYEISGSDKEFNGEFNIELKNISENSWISDNLYAIINKDENKPQAYMLFHSKLQINSIEKNNLSTIFNTISFIMASGLKNIKAQKEFYLMNRLKDRKEFYEK